MTEGVKLIDNRVLLEKVRQTLNIQEAKVIILIRQVYFGKVIIYKEGDKIVRQEKTEIIKD